MSTKADHKQLHADASRYRMIKALALAKEGSILAKAADAVLPILECIQFAESLDDVFDTLLNKFPEFK